MDKHRCNDKKEIHFLDYLGLDHIGHSQGPFSKLVPSKLKEMDDVIKMIHTQLKDWVKLNYSLW